MFSFAFLSSRLAGLRAWFSSPSIPARAAGPGVARRLMESAGARVGQNPHQARELRAAASAYLSVVR